MDDRQQARAILESLGVRVLDVGDVASAKATLEALGVEVTPASKAGRRRRRRPRRSDG